jgi:hypothetical protein
MPVFSINYNDRQRQHPQASRLIFIGMLAILSRGAVSGAAQQPAEPDPPAAVSALFDQVIANQKQSEGYLNHYERIERVESRKTGRERDPVATKVWRLFPTGPGFDRITLSPDGKPVDRDSYRAELEKLERYLVWAAQDGSEQKEAYAKAARKRKDRYDLIEATHNAFLFTFAGKETRDGRTLLRYIMEPNRKYKPTSRNTILFTRVRGTLWIDEQSSQLAKVEGSVTEDISLALFVAKVYKGSHFMQERYEVAPGLWEPTFEQYDFDGRKYLLPFSIHERTTYTGYKRVGPPKEALQAVRAELNKLRAGPARP